MVFLNLLKLLLQIRVVVFLSQVDGFLCSYGILEQMLNRKLAFPYEVIRLEQVSIPRLNSKVVVLSRSLDSIQ